MDSKKDVHVEKKEKSLKEGEEKNSELLPVPNDSVKSAAIVKYSAAEAPALYTRLRCNTNLNLPPSNWLSSSTETYGLLPSLLHKSGFSSFRIAHMFPDCIGQVDVVSDAENIKKLLKIPYSRGSVSMMIHRIGNTLLIDEFDIHRYLLREAENQWEWFKKFFFENFMEPVSKKDVVIHHKDNSRNALQQKSLASKFLYHSLVVADNIKKDMDEPQLADPSVPIPLPYKKIIPSLPEPKLEEEVPDPTSNHKFSRNVVWTFEDIQMLLGTDMPIFGGGTHPCISLRLRDMTKPINVLTGMDYWLDNLMCNVPEVVMCYHLNGIVQKYELIKTEDLPHLENSKFSPKVIRDIAQNILSFLKANATKAGHTYWLFKGKDDDVVKLYDLTCLCRGSNTEKGQTPFTVPVAMLLYRVARNMRGSDEGRRQAATIRMLLQNCLALLRPEKYAGIVTSAHFMMADLYVPAEADPKSPELVMEEEECQTKPEGNRKHVEEEEDRDDCGVKSLSLSNIGEVQMDEAEYIPPSPPPIGNDIIARCLDGIKHIEEGLRCIPFLAEIEGKEQNQEVNPESEVAQLTKTFPVPFQPLKKSGRDLKKKKKKKGKVQEKEEEKRILCAPRFDAVASWQNPDPKSFTWNGHLKTLLYEKAYLIYATLFEKYISTGNFGFCLHYIRMSLKIRKILKVMRPEFYGMDVDSYFLGPAGDSFFLIIQNTSHMDRFNREYLDETKFDRHIEMELESLGIADRDEYDLLFPSRLASLEELLLCSYKCYRRAAACKVVHPEHKDFQRHLGNILNEIGVFYMNQAAAIFQDMGKGGVNRTKDFKDYCVKSQYYLDEGIRIFDVAKDKTNLALLHSNLGRLMRLRAHFYGPVGEKVDEEKKKELAGQERNYYGKAVANYQKALQAIGERKHNPPVWDSVNWELSTALYSMASFYQDFPPFNQTHEEAMREVTETLHKALKYCDLETPGTRQLVYQFRSGMIHHRLASLYHKSYRSNFDESRRKKIIQLSKLHYERSAGVFLLLEHPAEYLRVQLERVALVEFQAENVNSLNTKIKYLENSLDLLLEAKSMFEIMMEGSRAIETAEEIELEKEKHVMKMTLDEQDRDEIENELTLLGFYEYRLRIILLGLTKLTLGKVDGRKESHPLGETYKKLYAMTLKKNAADRDPVEQAKWFYSLTSDISKTLHPKR